MTRPDLQAQVLRELAVFSVAIAVLWPPHKETQASPLEGKSGDRGQATPLPSNPTMPPGTGGRHREEAGPQAALCGWGRGSGRELAQEGTLSTDAVTTGGAERKTNSAQGSVRGAGGARFETGGGSARSASMRVTPPSTVS